MGATRLQRSEPLPVALAVTWPCLTLLLSALLALICTYFSLDFFALGDPLTGLRIRNEDVALRADAHLMAMTVLRPEQGDPNGQRLTERVVDVSSLDIFYLAPVGADNVFTVEFIQKMVEIEDKLLAIPGYDSHCLFDVDIAECSLLETPLRYLRNATSQEEVNDGLRRMWLDRDADKHPTLFHFCEEFDNETRLECPITRTVMHFGLPLAGYLNADDRRDDQLDLLQEWLENGLVEDGEEVAPNVFSTLDEYRNLNATNPDALVVTFFQLQLFNSEVLSILVGDLLFAGVSVALVLVIMVVHMRSLFLSAFAIVQVLLSFPFCFFIYRVVFGIELFGGLNIISIYLLFGIGADDVFILSDALFQSRTLLHGRGWTFRKRMAWAFHRATYTMTTTTVTTGFAFMMLATSSIPVVRYFGIFTALLIFTNYALVCSMYLAVLVLWARWFDEGKRWIPRLGATCASQDEIETSYASAAEESPEPGKVVESTASADSTDAGAANVAAGGLDAASANGDGSVSTDPEQHREEAFLERFFRDVYAKRVINNPTSRRAILVSFFVIIAVSIGLATQLRLATRGILFWPDDHPFALYLNNEFSFKKDDDNNMAVSAVWGLDYPYIDRTGTRETVQFDMGDSIFAPASKVDFDAEAAQEFLRDVCYLAVEERTAELNLLTPESLQGGDPAGRCFMAAFAMWRESRNESFPLPKPQVASSGSIEVDGIKIPAFAQVENLPAAMLEFLGRPAFGEEFFVNVGFHRDEDGRMRIGYASQDFYVNMTDDDSYRRRTEVSDGWDRFEQEVNEARPDEVGDMIYTEYNYFLWQRMQLLFVTNAFTSVALSMVLVFAVTTLATRNWRLAGLATFTVVLIILVVMAAIVIYGYRLGSIESVLLTLVLGVAVDYLLHIAVGYSDAQFDMNIDDREGRVTHSLTTLGTSITAGALTTFLAASILLVTTIVFFSKFGKIMITTVAVAYIFAIVFFPALLSAIGPNGTAGNACVPKHLREAAEDDEEKIAGSATPASTHSDSIVLRSPGSVRRVVVGFVVLFVALLAFGFGMRSLRLAQDEEREAREEAEEGGHVEIDDSVFMPKFTELTTGDWTEMRPGGETVCGRNTSYAFFVRRGAADGPVILEFEGGGACWSASTCQKATNTFKDTVESDRAEFRRVKEGTERRLGLSDVDGPYAGMTHVFVPYCTGDLHWGNSTVTYSDTVTVHHRGSVNAKSVIDWVLTELGEPPRVLVTGCSAGAYASSFWGAQLAHAFETRGASTKVVQMADAGMGVISSTFMVDSFPTWRALEGAAFPRFALPDDFPQDPIDLGSLSMPLLYRWIAQRFPNGTWSQYSSAADWIQAFFLLAQKLGEGTDVEAKDQIDWYTEMNDMYDAFIPENPANLLHMVGPGDYHCNIREDSHWHIDAGNEQPFFKILHDMFLNDVNPGNIDCRETGGYEYCMRGVDLRDKVDLY